MKKYILKSIVAMFIGCSLISCDKGDDLLFDDPQDPQEETLDIEIESSGGEYTFASNKIETIISPDLFNASVTNNTIVGNHAGETTAKIVADGITYNCNITVKAAYTYYVDMAIFLGCSKAFIEKTFGFQIYAKDNLYEYTPLSSHPSGSRVLIVYNDYNEVIACSTLFKSEHMTHVVDHLVERYAVYSVDDTKAYLGNSLEQEDASVMVLCDFENYLVTYGDMEYYNSIESVRAESLSIKNL